MGLLKLILLKTILKFDLNTNNNNLYIILNKKYLRSLLTILRYGSLFYGSILNDVSGFERTSELRQFNFINTVVYMFFLPRWSIKLFIIGVAGNLQQITNISEFFAGSTWPEREISELLGLNFFTKLDSRHLMLDYSFEGFPLLKQFSSSGYEELEYDIYERWLIYKPLKNRDNLEVWVN